MESFWKGSLLAQASGVLVCRFIPKDELPDSLVPDRSDWTDADKEQFKGKQPAGWLAATLRLAQGSKVYYYPMSADEVERMQDSDTDTEELAEQIIGIKT
jgi:hypothetical protein